jgi:hypothetical protein
MKLTGLAELLKMICEEVLADTDNPNLPTHVYRKKEEDTECNLTDYCGKDCRLPCKVQRGKATLWNLMKSFPRAREVAGEVYRNSTTHLVCAKALDNYVNVFLKSGLICRKLLVLVSKAGPLPVFWLNPLLDIHEFFSNAGLRFRELEADE